jgi:putative membrane protein
MIRSTRIDRAPRAIALSPRAYWTLRLAADRSPLAHRAACRRAGECRKPRESAAPGRYAAPRVSPSSREPLVLLGLTAIALVASGIAPHDRATWWLEVGPVLVGVLLLVATRRRFPLTPLLYRLLFLHALVLIYGGHYTYARVPLGFWFQDLLDLARNPYDRLGHFAQGFVPAILAREVLLRTSPLEPGKWLVVLCTAVSLAFSALYELFEWWAALIGGENASAFLGTQGDVWDTQWDMFLALVGALTALAVLGPVHARQLERLVPD